MSIMVELMKARPMLACLKALEKFSKLSHEEGRVITFVELYSLSVLKAVIRQDTTGRTEIKEKRRRVKYLNTVSIIFFIYINMFMA